MLSILNQRSNTHNSCEDSVHVVENESFIDGIISDGCSTGIKSHFASQAFCYAFAKHGKQDAYTDESVINNVQTSISLMMTALDINEMNLLATCILFHYNKNDKSLRIRVFGDGYYYINDVGYVVDQNNTPDYMGYHIDRGFVEFNSYIKKYPEIVYQDVDRFIICSDGIERIERSSLQPVALVDPNVLLFNPPVSKNYLERMWNLIKRDGFTLSDDLTMVSYDSKN